MNIQFLTTYDLLVNVEGGPNVVDVNGELNNQNLHALALADQVVAKDQVLLVRAVTEEATTHIIHAKNGKAYEAYVPNYNAGEIANSINEPRNTYVLIGNISIQKHQVSRIASKA